MSLSDLYMEQKTIVIQIKRSVIDSESSIKKKKKIFLYFDSWFLNGRAVVGTAVQNYSMMGFQLDHNVAVLGLWDSGVQGNIICKTVGLSKA